MLTKEQEAVVDIVCSTTDKTIAVNSVAGSGKGLWECTAILTKKGYVALRDLKEGDYVIGKDGKETKIIGYYPRGFQPCYKMTFSNGHTLMCDKDHLWTFCYSHERSKNPFPTYHTLSVESLVKLPLRKKSGKYSTWNLYLPLVDPVQFNEDEVPDFDPYVLGIIIGDGCLRDHCGFSNTEQDIIDTVTTYANSLGDTVKKSGDNDYRFTGTNILKYLRKVGLDDTYSCDRFIPKSYLYGSIQTRLDILAGLLDTDGTVILSNKVKRIGSSYEYSTTSYKLFTEVTFLCESLGLTVTHGVKEEPTYLYKKQKRVGRKAYRLYIKPSKRFPKLHRSAKHDARWNPTPQTFARIYIKDIKPCAYHKTICIKVDAEDELFVTERCLVTHNTTTCAAVVDACKPKKGFYTAFNKAIVQDSAKKFGDKVTCKTIHALAYKYVRPKRSVEELNYLTIKENLSYEDKAIIIQALDDFFRSSYTDLELFLNVYNSKDNHLHDIILNYADMMLEGKIPPTFNFLLKCLHIMLKDKELSIDFDLLLLDECQDVTAVTLEIFKLINAEHKVMFGDRYQNIYSFMDTVNAFEELEGVETLHLTRSFRCTPLIASIVEDYGRKYLNNDFRFEGNPDITKTTDTIAFISRTNASLIERMYKLMNKGRKFSLTRDINEIFSLPIALLSANSNRPVFYQKYKFIQKEYIKYRSSTTYHRTFFDYLIDTTKDVAIENGCKLLLDLNKRGINIYDLKKKVQDMDPDPNTILTTAHAFKGLEADTVYIEDDLNNTLARLKSDTSHLKSVIENLNTYYVALSRARFSLVNYI